MEFMVNSLNLEAEELLQLFRTSLNFSVIFWEKEKQLHLPNKILNLLHETVTCLLFLC